MLQAIIARKAAAFGISMLLSAVGPYITHDRPVIKWVAGEFGPRIVEQVQPVLERKIADRLESR